MTTSADGKAIFRDKADDAMEVQAKAAHISVAWMKEAIVNKPQTGETVPLVAMALLLPASLLAMVAANKSRKK